MKEITLNAKVRSESGKKQCRDLRRKGLVPSVVYGVERNENGLPLSKSIAVTEKELAKLLYTPNVYIVNLNIEGNLIKVILKELQCDPVTDRQEIVPAVSRPPGLSYIVIRHTDGIRRAGTKDIVS